eukprot:2144609-Pyramimonas_sp.AAC.1
MVTNKSFDALPGSMTKLIIWWNCLEAPSLQISRGASLRNECVDALFGVLPLPYVVSLLPSAFGNQLFGAFD